MACHVTRCHGHATRFRSTHFRLVAALMGVALFACTGEQASTPTSAPVTASTPGVTATSLPDASGGALVLADGASRSPTTSVPVTLAVPGATEARLARDPTMSDASWLPIADATSIELDDTGYQQVFAQTRDATGVVSPVMVAGIDVDPTWAAATATAAPDKRHEVSNVGLVATNVLRVRIEAGRVVTGANGKAELIGRPLDAENLDDPTSYSLSDASVVGVSRVSRPTGAAPRGDGTYDYAMAHDLYLTLREPLRSGVPHLLTFHGIDVDDHSFTIDPTSTISPAVHVNQVGFAPDDDGKVAVVSAWTGRAGGIPQPDPYAFTVRDVASGRTAFEGTTTPHQPASGGEYGRGDLTGAPVQLADFTALDVAGRYEVCVMPLGCSLAFDVSETSTWRRAAVAVFRSLYHQRSGVALTEPYTSVVRPRPFHPDDGVVFHETTLTMLDDLSNVGRDDRFDEYEAADTGVERTDVWGGHFDAGDWNSRIQHLSILRTAIDLVALFPDTFGDLDLDIPESGDAVPDVIDEGLWDLSLFERLQRPDGGVPGGVDQGRFAEEDETSWDNDIDVYIFAPDVWSTYQFAATAAAASVALQTADASRADRLADAATRAMTWAESHWAATADRPAALLDAVLPERAAAAAAMLRLTGDRSWNAVFADSSDLDERPAGVIACPGGLCDATWAYASLPIALTDPAMHDNAVATVVENADAAAAALSTTAFGWAMEHPDVPLVWGLGPSTPHGLWLMRGYALTQDARYRTAAVRAASFSLGGNPLDLSFATGLGTTSVRTPLLIDARHGGLPAVAGTFVYGIHDLGFASDDDWVDQYVLRPSGLEPAVTDSPTLWSFFDLGLAPMMSEFTVQQSHVSALWTLGALAATS